MVSGNRSIVLEIYGLKGGRWSIHSNYAIQDREDCLEEAKELDAKGRFEAVCVVRETYNEKDNSARQAVIYHSPKLTSPPPVAIVTEGPAAAPAEAPQKSAAGGEGAWRKSDGNKKPAKTSSSTASAKKKKAKKKTKPSPPSLPSTDGPTLADVLPRLLGVAAISLIGALALAYVAYALLQFLPTFNIVLGKTMAQSIIITVFLAGFIFIFIPLLKRYVPTIQSSRNRGPQLATAHPAPAPNVTMPKTSSAVSSPRATGTSEDSGGSAQTSVGDEATKDQCEDDQSEAVPHLNRSSAGEEANVSEVEPDAAPPENAPADDGTKLKKKPDVSAEILKFIGDSLEPLAKAGHKINAFNRFGLTLYFAGAGEYMATRYKMSEEEIANILCAHVQVLGHTAEMARGFCANMDEYLVNPKYFQMYEKGRTAIGALQSDPSAKLTIVDAIDDWNKPTPVTSKSEKEFVAVLFTDIVGSTALTQERGDDAAQLVVHEHNSIVRDALALHGGKEIKHTGDGIMATFSQITNAVEGAVAMQEACQRANASNPDLGLGLCIGVNAGEPIHEDGDIFGTPVQMAARVLSKAEGEEIAVSNLVREMCTGKSYKFDKKGDYELKGFPEPVPIYLVEWAGGLNAPEKTDA